MLKAKLLPLITLLIAFASCGDDGDDIVIERNKNTQNPSTPVVNENRNTTGPTEAQNRLEFPKLKGGNSTIVVHKCLLNSKTNHSGVNYSLEWDKDKKATRWVCYQVYGAIRVSNVSRPAEDPWDYDPDIPQADQQATYNELSKSNPPLPNSTYYEKGHIVASADRLCSRDANNQTFYMTNIYPMVHDFNGGIWSNMESRVRSWGSQADTLYVCKGGTIDNDAQILAYTIGKHPVPKYFYMAVLSKKGTAYEAIAFWIEHQDGNTWNPLADYTYSIDWLEQKTGIDFFCNLPDDIENIVESRKTPSYWNLK